MNPRNTSHLLLNDRPVVILPRLALAVGVQEAVILQQVHYWVCVKRESGQPADDDGRHWVYNSYPQWQRQLPFWCKETIARAFRNLEKQGLLLSRPHSGDTFDRTKEYTIDYDALIARDDECPDFGTDPTPEQSEETCTVDDDRMSRRDVMRNRTIDDDRMQRRDSTLSEGCAVDDDKESRRADVAQESVIDDDRESRRTLQPVAMYTKNTTKSSSKRSNPNPPLTPPAEAKDHREGGESKPTQNPTPTPPASMTPEKSVTPSALGESPAKSPEPTTPPPLPLPNLEGVVECFADLQDGQIKPTDAKWLEQEARRLQTEFGTHRKVKMRRVMIDVISLMAAAQAENPGCYRNIHSMFVARCRKLYAEQIRQAKASERPDIHMIIREKVRRGEITPVVDWPMEAILWGAELQRASLS